MASNSKLNDYLRAVLSELKFDAKTKDIELAHNGRTTLAFHHKGNTVELSLSVASPDEAKFRRKVGEFHALSRFFDNATVKMAVEDFEEFYYIRKFSTKKERKAM